MATDTPGTAQTAMQTLERDLRPRGGWCLTQVEAAWLAMHRSCEAWLHERNPKLREERYLNFCRRRPSYLISSSGTLAARIFSKSGP